MLRLEITSMSSIPCCHRPPRTPSQSHQHRQSCSWTSPSTRRHLAGRPCLRLLCRRYGQLHLQVLHICQKPYLTFCLQYKLPPCPSECPACLSATFLTQQGVMQSISAYLSALRHLEVSAGFDPSLLGPWPHLQYVRQGI